MSIESEGQTPEARAKRYFAKAEQARQLLAGTGDPTMKASLQKLIDDLEYLAHRALGECP